MENNLNNTYLFKALDAYPYELEETLEALNYALSYDGKDAQALCLMGRIHAEQLHDYVTAKQYYAEAIANNMEMPNTYEFYIQTLLWNEDYKEAEKLIGFAFSIKGVNKSLLHVFRGIVLEEQGFLKEALKTYKMALKTSTSNCFINSIEGEVNRVKHKIKPKKKKNKKDGKKRKGGKSAK
ncbi:hypothetical protein [Seonamhaeicola marinus]|uniref:Uncharacterized protein n=1 Tax=Seonamhaeicola marinus TaxID=1912246 RepID=A0A5D0HU45_9FLAO|nr:hypothetical protein [Seonamhaeicola marinus]TYA73989.1 hypothetical protein FUA24_11625 [Seonamhaeicola marinus]